MTPQDDGTQAHPEAEDCLVRLTDSFGVSIDDRPEPEPEQPAEEDDVRQFPYVEEVLTEIYDAHKIPRLGGVSSGRGWSSVSTYQRCPYLWKRRYVDPLERTLTMGFMEPQARAIGTVVHTFLSIYYMRMIDQGYPLTPEAMRDALIAKANPTFVNEGWRVFAAYAAYYHDEEVWPLAIERDLVDPRTKDSCRYDLIAYFPESNEQMNGTWIVEHKTSQRFDENTLFGWANDGEVLGQVMLWKRLKLDLKYGPLRGVIVNLLGKQKTPEFHRTMVSHESWQIEAHKDDLKYWDAKIHLSIATDNFPRSRNGCIGRYGKCDLYSHCSGGA